MVWFGVRSSSLYYTGQDPMKNKMAAVELLQSQIRRTSSQYSPFVSDFFMRTRTRVGFIL